MAHAPNALSQHFSHTMASGDQTVLPKAEDVEGGVSGESSSVEPQALPGNLPWERDLEMVSNFLDRKVKGTDRHRLETLPYVTPYTSFPYL